MTRIKICGLTSLADAQEAVAAGADYLGFILYAGSKRAVDLDQVCRITEVLRRDPGCPILVGVFVNESLATMVEAMTAARLDAAQLHGEEVPALIGEPSSPLYGRAYKALRPATLAEARAEAAWYVPPETNAHLPALLVDAYDPVQRGGTGRAGDWALAAALATEVTGLMLAGGLTPDNVATAIATVRPYAVDVASGIESAPGIKDRHRMTAFINAVRRADAEETTS